MERRLPAMQCTARTPDVIVAGAGLKGMSVVHENYVTVAIQTK